MDDLGGKHCCRWIDCSALYDQQEELVRHIEKVHIDQRKGEDFTCFWAGCPRRYKPFNARYKLLIHMRVHSGEKPNKCTFEGCKKPSQGSKISRFTCGATRARSRTCASIQAARRRSVTPVTAPNTRGHIWTLNLMLVKFQDVPNATQTQVL